MKRFYLAALFFILGFFSSLGAHAENFILSTAAEFQTILNTAATNGAAAGNNIVLPSGVLSTNDNGGNTFTYSSSQNSHLTIIGAEDGTSRLDGANAKQVLSITSTGGTGSELLLSNFTIQNGSFPSNPGGGLNIDFSAGQGNVTLNSLTVSGNSGGNGGGLYAATDSGNITVTDSTFTHNTSDNDGGGFYLSANTGTITASGITSTHNAAVSTYGGGFLICLHACTLSNSTFDSNQASGPDGDVGGLAAITTDGTIELNQLTITHNTAVGSGGGLSVQASGTGSATLSNSTITDNQASHTIGGAIFGMNGGTLSLQGNTIKNNTATISCGGFEVENLTVASTVVNINSNFIQGNSSADIGGAAIALLGGTVTFTNNVVTGNTATGVAGGALFSSGNTVTLDVTNNTFTQNTAATNGGGLDFIADGNGGTYNIYNNIVYGNTATNQGDDIYIDTNGNTNTINLFNNDFLEFCVLTNCDPTALGANQGSNIHTDPLFVSVSGGNFSISPNSPATNVALTTAPAVPSADIAGNTRSTPDLGAYEYVVPSASSGGGCSLQTLPQSKTSIYLLLLIVPFFLGLKCFDKAHSLN